MTRANVAGTTAFGANHTIDGDAYEVGASYTFGPAMVSINYMEGNNEAANYNGVTGVKTLNDRDEKRQTFGISGSYTLAPGVVAMATAYSVKQEGNQAVGGTLDLTNKAQGVLGALILNF